MARPGGDVTLHERVAEALGWSEAEARSFSLQSLREVLRGAGREKLVRELDELIRSRRYVRSTDRQ